MADVRDENWETFEPGPAGRRGGYPQITITKKGAIRLNRYLTRRTDLKNGVILHFDRVKRRIGIQPAAAGSEIAVTAHPTRTRGYVEIYAVAFLKRFGIKFARTLVIDRIDTTPTGIITVDLADAREPLPRQRPSSPASSASV